MNTIFLTLLKNRLALRTHHLRNAYKQLSLSTNRPYILIVDFPMPAFGFTNTDDLLLRFERRYKPVDFSS